MCTVGLSGKPTRSNRYHPSQAHATRIEYQSAPPTVATGRLRWKRINRNLIGIALAITGLVRPQMTPRPKFAVTSVKPNRANCCVSGGLGNGGSRNRDVTLKMLIGTACRVQEFQISGGPGWIASDRFDVEGKAEDPNADFDQLRLMLQSLLEGRFQLQLHREVKEAPTAASDYHSQGLSLPEILSKHSNFQALSGSSGTGTAYRLIDTELHLRCNGFALAHEFRSPEAGPPRRSRCFGARDKALGRGRFVDRRRQPRCGSHLASFRSQG